MSKTAKENLLARIREELAQTSRGNNDIDSVVAIVDAGLELGDSHTHEAVQLDEFGKGKSAGFRNVVKFNLSKCVEALLTGTINAAGSLSYPWLGILGAMLMIRQLKECYEVPISENGCRLLWSICKLRSAIEGDELAESQIKAELKSELSSFELPALSDGEIKLAFNELVDLGIVEEIDEATWKVIDFVQTTSS